MKSLIATSTVIAALFVTPTFASSTSSILLNNFHLSLTSINPDSETTPSLAFYNKNSVIGGIANDNYDNQTSSGFAQYNNSNLGVAPKSDSASSPSNNAQSSASITGDIFNNATMQSNGASQGNEGSFSSGLNSTSFFTLGAYTKAILTANYQTSENITVGGFGLSPLHPNEFARTYVGVSVDDPNGQTYSDSREATTDTLDGIPVNSSDASMLSLAFSNDSSKDISGYFFRAIFYNSGYSLAPIAEAPSSVPLPATAPLLLSGLGLLGFSTRKRKSAKV